MDRSSIDRFGSAQTAAQCPRHLETTSSFDVSLSKKRQKAREESAESPFQSAFSAGSRLSRPWFLIGFLAVIHTAFAFSCAKVSSVTHDEYWHLPVGLLHWRTARFDFDRLNPPLIRLWAALPLLATDAQVDPAPADLLGYGDMFLQRNGKTYRRLFLLARGMIVVLSVLTGLVLARWAEQWFGGKAACLAALLWFADPNVLAHGSLVTTDVGAAFFFVLTLYLLWRWARERKRRQAIAFGVWLGLAQLAKYTCVLLVPVSIVLWFAWRPRQRPADAGRAAADGAARSLVGQWGLALALSLVVINAGYLFRGSGTPLRQYRFQSQMLRGLADRMGWLADVPVPLPADYLLGLDAQRHVMEGKHPVFLDGQWRTDGFRSYYVKTLIYKLPHSVHWLLLVSLVLLLDRGDPDRRRRFSSLWLLLPFGLLVALASFSRMQLGLRYVLPVLPLLYLVVAQCGQRAD
ncbi:MAG TPA: glycosyltransferase family 39 protein, partial [Planctomycetaceae bacterium]|nr:glycosyltransferase family 39 protein [Planctomycetaceae bacterium]